MNPDKAVLLERANALLAATADFVSREYGDATFFPSLTDFLVTTLGADYAHVALLEPDAAKVRVVAGRIDGRTANIGYVYALSGTPCEQVVGKAHQCHTHGVQSLFPRDHDLTTLGAEAYIGEPLLDGDGTPIGLIALVYRQVLDDAESRRDCLRILASRASAAVFHDRVEANRKRHVDALTEREARLRLVLDATAEAIYGVDNENRCTFANRSCLKMLGYQREDDLVGHNLHELIHHSHPDGRPYPKSACLLHQATCIGEPIHVDSEVHWRRDGSCFPVEYWSRPIVRDGQVAGAVVTFVDITQRKQQEQRLLLAELALRHVDTASYLANADGRLIDVNEAACRMLGYRRDELLAMAVTEVDAETTTTSWRQFHDQIKVAGTLRIESHHRRKNGEVFPVEISVCYFESHGESFILGLASDITERKHAEEEIRKLSQAVAQNPNSILITDPDGRIEYTNAAFTQTTGYSFEEAKGRPASFLGSPLTPAATYEQLWTTIKAGKPWRGEFVNRTKDGGEQFVYAHIAPIRQGDGRISHFVAIHEDISEKKRNAAELDRHRHHLEELLAERSGDLIDANAALRLARDAAEAASRAKTTFLANMSHEIRTPLNAISGMAHLLRRNGVTPPQAQRLDKIDEAVRHLLAIISDILDLAKIEVGRLTIEAGALSVASLVDAVAEMIRDIAQAKGLKLVTACGALPTQLIGDATRLRQALLNYASNAVRFTDQGTVTLRCQVEEEDAHGVMLRFHVDDTGIGIAPAVLPRLFHAFEQADNSSTRKFGGTGLGLAITKRLARLMGGDADAMSTPGVGSSFWFTARLSKCAGDEQSAPAHRGSAEDALLRDHAGTRVLIAEDDPINREVAVELLGSVGIDTDVAANGAEAIRLAGEHRYQLVLMDMQMPVLNGLAATVEIRRLPTGKTIPILAMTANVYAEDRRRCIEAGMNDFIVKPVHPEALFAKLLQWLEHGKGAATGESSHAQRD